MPDYKEYLFTKHEEEYKFNLQQPFCRKILISSKLNSSS